MPTTLIAGYRLRFYSSDVSEPPHMHVLRGGNEAEVWHDPVELEYNHGYNQSKLNRIVKLTRQNCVRLSEVWNAHFGQ